MSDKSLGKFVRKMRIAVNKNGKVLTWSPRLGNDPNYFNGWRNIYENGTQDILDKAEAVQLAQTSTSARERKLTEENARLTELLAAAQQPAVGGIVDPTVPAEGPVTDKPDTEAIPKMPQFDDGDGDLTSIIEEPIVEAPIVLAPEAPDKSKASLGRMKKETLIVHAHALDREVDLPDDASRDELAIICWDMQEARKTTPAGE